MATNLRPTYSLLALEEHDAHQAQEWHLHTQRQPPARVARVAQNEVGRMTLLLLKRRNDVAAAAREAQAHPSALAADGAPRPSRLADALRMQGPASGGAPLPTAPAEATLVVASPLKPPSGTEVPPLPMRLPPVAISHGASAARTATANRREHSSPWAQAVAQAAVFQDASIRELGVVRDMGAPALPRRSRDSAAAAASAAASVPTHAPPLRGSLRPHGATCTSAANAGLGAVIPDRVVKRSQASFDAGVVPAPGSGGVTGTKWTLASLKAKFVFPHNVHSLVPDTEASGRHGFPSHDERLYRIRLNTSAGDDVALGRPEFAPASEPRSPSPSGSSCDRGSSRPRTVHGGTRARSHTPSVSLASGWREPPPPPTPAVEPHRRRRHHGHHGRRNSVHSSSQKSEHGSLIGSSQDLRAHGAAHHSRPYTPHEDVRGGAPDPLATSPLRALDAHEGLGPSSPPLTVVNSGGSGSTLQQASRYYDDEDSDDGESHVPDTSDSPPSLPPPRAAYVQVEFGASRDVADGTLERRFLSAARELWADPGTPPPLATAEPQMRALLAEVVAKLPLAALWNVDSAEAAQAVFSDERDSETPGGGAVARSEARIDLARALLLSGPVARVCVGMAALAFWGVVVPRFKAAAPLRDEVSGSRLGLALPTHELLGVTQDDFAAAEANAPDLQLLAAAIVREQAGLDEQLRQRGLHGLSHTRPLLLLCVRAAVEMYLRGRWPYLFLLEASLAEYSRRFGLAPLVPLVPEAHPHASAPLTSALLRSPPTHVSLDCMVAALLDPARLGSHIAPLQSGPEARPHLRKARIEMRRLLLKSQVRARADPIPSPDGAEAGVADAPPLFLFPGESRNVVYTTSAHVRALLAQPLDPQTRKFLSHGMIFVLRGGRAHHGSLPLAADGSLRLGGPSGPTLRASMLHLSLIRAVGRYRANGEPGELLADGTRRAGVKGGSERLAVLAALLHDLEALPNSGASLEGGISMPSLSEALESTTLDSVLGGGWHTRAHPDGGSSVLSGLELTASLASFEDELAFEGARERSNQLLATLDSRDSGGDLSEQGAFQDEGGEELCDADRAAENARQADEADRFAFANRIRTVHYSHRASPLQAAAGKATTEFTGLHASQLSRARLGLDSEASWLALARQRGPVSSVLRAIADHEEAMRIASVVKRRSKFAVDL